MKNLFSYKSKIEIPAYTVPPEVVDKFIHNLQRWLSKSGTEDAIRDRGNISFAANPASFSRSVSVIGSGEINVTIQQGWLLIVEYRLSYMFPLLAILALNLFLWGLSYLNIKMDSMSLFQTVMAISLLVNIINIFLTIRDFPDKIIEIWEETKKSVRPSKP